MVDFRGRSFCWLGPQCNRHHQDDITLFGSGTIIPVSKWLITMVSIPPLFDRIRGPLPFMAVSWHTNGVDPNYLHPRKLT